MSSSVPPSVRSSVPPRFRGAPALLTAAALMLAPLAALATPMRIAGRIESLTGSVFAVKTADGTVRQITLDTGFRLSGLVPATLADVKTGGFIGVGSVPSDGGGQSAVEVTIFPPALVGTGEGSRPWDVAPEGTMTNATVQEKVATVKGNELTMVYKGGSRKITVPEGVPIVAITPADRADLKPGAAVTVRADEDAKGALKASRVIVGLKGTVPPI